MWRFETGRTSKNTKVCHDLSLAMNTSIFLIAANRTRVSYSYVQITTDNPCLGIELDASF